MQRHASLVLDVGRRALHSPHDAEDVFQATFLVLARKASSLPWRDSVAGWLCQLARGDHVDVLEVGPSPPGPQNPAVKVVLQDLEVLNVANDSLTLSVTQAQMETLFLRLNQRAVLRYLRRGGSSEKDQKDGEED